MLKGGDMMTVFVNNLNSRQSMYLPTQSVKRMLNINSRE